MKPVRDHHIQFVKFATVGICSNAILYFLYLAITSFNIGPKLTMSILYTLGVSQTFIVNRRWTFQHLDKAKSTFARYIFSYLLGYLVNLTALVILVDKFNLPHQVVQGFMIIIIAIMMFTLQKKWVFK